MREYSYTIELIEDSWYWVRIYSIIKGKRSTIYSIGADTRAIAEELCDSLLARCRREML